MGQAALAKTTIVFPILARVGAGPAHQQAHIVVARPLIQLHCWMLTGCTLNPIHQYFSNNCSWTFQPALPTSGIGHSWPLLRAGLGASFTYSACSHGPVTTERCTQPTQRIPPEHLILTTGGCTRGPKRKTFILGHLF